LSTIVVTSEGKGDVGSRNEVHCRELEEKQNTRNGNMYGTGNTEEEIPKGI